VRDRELTPWFVDVLPARKGVYNVSCERSKQSGQWYAHFNGKRFGYFSAEPEMAFLLRRQKTNAVALSWRGMSHPPKEAQ
jgi:hypothetical protein